MDRPIWEGVYAGFAEVPSQGSGHCGDTWIKRSLSRAEQERALVREGKRALVGDTLLPAFAASELARKSSVSVLDFGGGLGMDYLATAGSLPSLDGLEYHVVEVEAVCRAGRRLYADDQAISFHEDVPDRTFDIVYSNSAIQYVDNWMEMLSALSGAAGRYLIFMDLLAGENPTYASGQNYYDSIIPSWFFNYREFRECMKDNGFDLVLQTDFRARILGKYDYLPQDNFEEGLRVGHAKNCVFIRGACDD